MKHNFFGNKIEPACEYCENGRKTKDGQMVLCEKHGAVAPYYSCKSFVYSPLLRTPKPQITLKHGYKEEDFKL